jgi:microcystin-dependent protein
MAQPYVGEIRMFAGNFAPAGWSFCDGSLVPISENDTLFTLIGTTYGGDGQETFALPDLRGRLPLHMGNSFMIGEPGGAEEITLTIGQIPGHSHPLMCVNGSASDPNPQNNLLAEQLAVSAYQSQPGSVAMATQSIGSTGGNQPHTNFQPYLCVNFIISLFGIFPTQS